MAETHITKRAAAHRQLRAAIRMFFDGEEDLAVHTVASAAYRLFSDLKGHRGRDEVGDVYQTMIFYAVREHRRGTLPKYLAEDVDFMKWVRGLAEVLPITEDMEYEDLRTSVPPNVAKRYWVDRNKAANFLKHADRDPGDHLSADEIDNFLLLMLAYGSCIDLGDDLRPEGYVLWLYSQVRVGETGKLPEHLATDVELLSNDEQLRLFSEVLTEMRSEERARADAKARSCSEVER